MRVISLLVAVLFAGQGVLPALHYVLSPHSVCPEHGELVEGHASAEPVSPRASHGPAWQAADEDAHDHDHCQTCARSRSEALSPGTLLVRLPEALAPNLAVASPERAIPLGSARYRLAPKQSPPLAAS